MTPSPAQNQHNPQDDQARAFGQLVAYWRSRTGMGLRTIAAVIPCSHQFLGHIEAGERWPDRPAAEALDATLGASGAILTAWTIGQEVRLWQGRVGRSIRASVRESLKLTKADDEGLWPDLTAHATGLAENYLGKPPAEMLNEAMAARSIMLRRLESPTADLPAARRALAIIQGVLAYSTLDLGHPDAAKVHANTAETMAARSGDRELLAWTIATQAFIRRFTKEWADAIIIGERGLALGSIRGAGRARLLSGMAMSQSRTGDLEAAKNSLAASARARDEIREDDELTGLFEFTFAKQQSFIAASLQYSTDPDDLQRAVDASLESRAVWAAGLPEDVPTRDERMVRVHQASVHVQAGDLGEVAATIEPLLGLPIEQKLSWLTRELANVEQALAAPRYADSFEAGQLRDLIRTGI